MKKLYIEFTRPHKDYVRVPLISWLIRTIEGTPYSHVRLVWENSTGKKLVYEADGTDVKFIGTISQEIRKVEVLDSFEIDLTDKEYRALIDLCIKYAGVSYGTLQVLGIGLSYLPFVNKNPFADGEKSQVCSELTARILKDVKGIGIKDDFDTAGPRAINKALTELTNTRGDIRKGFI